MRDHCKECVCISLYINISYSLISVSAPKNWISISLYYKHAVMSDWSETHLFLQVKHLCKNQSTQNETCDSWRSVPQCENGSRVVAAVLSVTNTPVRMWPTSAVPCSLPTSLPFNQRSLHSRPPQPVRWPACPDLPVPLGSPRRPLPTNSHPVRGRTDPACVSRCV